MIALALVEMVETEQPNQLTFPKTGDNSNLALWFVLLLVSGGCNTNRNSRYQQQRKAQCKIKSNESKPPAKPVASD